MICINGTLSLPSHEYLLPKNNHGTQRTRLPMSRAEPPRFVLVARCLCSANHGAAHLLSASLAIWWFGARCCSALGSFSRVQIQQIQIQNHPNQQLQGYLIARPPPRPQKKKKKATSLLVPLPPQKKTNPKKHVAPTSCGAPLLLLVQHRRRLGRLSFGQLLLRGQLRLPRGRGSFWTVWPLAAPRGFKVSRLLETDSALKWGVQFLLVVGFRPLLEGTPQIMGRVY